MLKLMKYEFRKQLMTKIMLLAVLGLMELYFIYGVLAGKTDTTMRAVIFLTVLAFIGILFVSFECIMTYYNDLKTKQSYMLFMVPETTFSVMGAKILSAMLQIFLTSLVFGVVGCLDILLVVAKFSTIDQLIDTVQMVLRDFFSLNLNAGTILISIIEIVVSWICTVIIAMLAITLGATFMANSKLRGIVSFVFFIVIQVAVSKLMSIVSDQFSGNAVHAASIVFALAVIALAYPVTAWMLKQKVSL